jgi:hypothetical protein
MDDKHIVVPTGWELELRREAVVDSARWRSEFLLGREIIWVETLGL